MNTTHAKVETSIPIHPVTDADGGRWLRIQIPNGWDDVKKISRKVLSFDGRTYTFRSWNSDTLLCHFKEDSNVAKVR